MLKKSDPTSFQLVFILTDKLYHLSVNSIILVTALYSKMRTDIQRLWWCSAFCLSIYHILTSANF